MSIRHVSEESVGNGNFPISDVPDMPVLYQSSTNLVSGTNTAGIVLTLAATGGAVTGATVVSFPSILYTSTSYSAPSTTATVTAAFSADTPYVFTVYATNALYTSPITATSVTLVPYSTRSGYFFGGTSSTNSDKIAFPSEVRATLATAYSSAEAGAASNSGTAGYLGAGNYPTNPSSKIDKITFSTDVITTLSATIGNQNGSAGFSNNGAAGYFAGGGVSSPYLNSYYKLTYSGETSAIVATSSLSNRVQHPAAASNNGSFAYIAGGSTSGGQATCVSTVDKLTFSGDTTSTLVTGLAATAWSNQGFANSGTAAYFGSGFSTAAGYTTSIYRFAFSNDARTTLSGSINSGYYRGAGCSDQARAGYFGQGNGTEVLRCLFSTDTVSALSVGLSKAPSAWPASLSNCGAF